MERQPRIMVVDDTPRNMKVLEASLAPRGYAISGVTSGAAALHEIAAQPPDLVWLDVIMPGMDGFEVCRRLRAEPATRLLPAVMITASGKQEKVSALEAGRRRLRPEAVQPGRAAGASRFAAADQDLPRHHPAAGRRGWPSGTARWRQLLWAIAPQRALQLRQMRRIGGNEYGAIGPVVHLAAKLAEAARAGQILISQRVQLATEQLVDTTTLGEQAVAGLARPAPVFAVEVVELIVRGCTNREIAEELVIAEGTAVRHVANILDKLDLHSRAQVAVWAMEQPRPVPQRLPA